MTISLPAVLLARIDRLARADNRPRSNWVATKLDAVTAAKLGVEKLFNEAGETRSVGHAGGFSTTSTRYSVNEGEPAPRLTDEPAKYAGRSRKSPPGSKG